MSRTPLFPLLQVVLAVLAGKFKNVYSELRNVCHLEELQISCDPTEMIVIESAYFGRMTQGRCIVEEDFIGCQNDVLSLLDIWCSGKHRCNVLVPNDDLEDANSNCKRYLIKYLTVEYRCQIVNTVCSSSSPTILASPEGYISSLLTDSKGCGSNRSPWIISASQGQIIQLDLLDFSPASQSSNLVTCPISYGLIRERALGIKQSFCGRRGREITIYTSKTSSVEIYILSQKERRGDNFIIYFKVTGCSEIPRPPNAWYKREGHQAVIGCETSNREWKLTCIKDNWIGEVGNCSERVVLVATDGEKIPNVGVHSVVVMTGIAGAAVVLCVIAIVIGTVYIKKYRMHQETKHLLKNYSTLEKNTLAYYRPQTLDPSMHSDIAWDNTLPLESREQCTCSTLPISEAKTIPVGGSSLERQSLYSSIKST